MTKLGVRARVGRFAAEADLVFIRVLSWLKKALTEFDLKEGLAVFDRFAIFD